MARAKATHDWDIGASVMCIIANANRDPKKQRQPFSPNHFHPYRHVVAGSGMKINKGNIRMLRKLIVKK